MPQSIYRYSHTYSHMFSQEFHQNQMQQFYLNREDHHPAESEKTHKDHVKNI